MLAGVVRELEIDLAVENKLENWFMYAIAFFREDSQFPTTVINKVD